MASPQAHHPDVPPGQLHPEVRRGRSRLLNITVVTGLFSTLAITGMTVLHQDQDLVRGILEARSWGVDEVTDREVAAMTTESGDVVLAALGSIALTAAIWFGVHRLWRLARWAAVVIVVLCLLTAAFWSVDGGQLMRHGGGLGVAVLAAVCAMGTSCAVWLLVAFNRLVRDAFDR